VYREFVRSFLVNDRLHLMLKSYFSFSWLALQEYLPEKRRKWLKRVWIVTTFIVGSFIADFLGVPLTAWVRVSSRSI